MKGLRATSDELAGDRPVMLSVGGSNADESCESLKEMVCGLVWANRRLNQLLSRQTLHCCDLSAKLAEVTYNYAVRFCAFSRTMCDALSCVRRGF